MPWDPEQYLRFEDERGRPFNDLLARVAGGDARTVVDLGCGPGNTTVRLLERWPDAVITGIDSSAEMIERAKALEVPGRLEFRVGDLRDWQPDSPVDVLVSSATLQWVPDHLALLPRLIRSLAPHGSFGFQVPGNFGEPSHVLLKEVASSPEWEVHLAAVVESSPRSLEPEDYLRTMLSTGASSEVWETTYLHVLSGPDAVLDWVTGTALRPYLQAVAKAGADANRFTEQYRRALRDAYPPDADGRTVFPFRRIFGVARRTA